MSRRPRLDDLPPQPAAAAMYGQKGIIDFQEANMLANPMLANPFLLASLQANNNAMPNPAVHNPYLANLNPMPNPMLAAASGAAAFAPPDVMAQNILAAQALAQIQGRADQSNNSLALLQQQQQLASMQQQTAMQQLAMQQAALSLPFGADAHTAALLAAQSATGACCTDSNKKSNKNRGDFNSNPSKQPLTPQMSIAVAQAKAVADILRCNDSACNGNVKPSTRKQNNTTASSAGGSAQAKPIGSRAGPGGASMGKTTSNAKNQADHKLRENIRRCVESRH